ncbi:unnamed protein product [Rhodiola kirilowii]
MKLLGQKVKRNQNVNGKGKERSRILISVNVVGSAGPIRLIVNEEDFVVDVVRSILKIYAREGRLPVLGSDANDFLLFCPAAASDFLEPLEMIGRYGARNFLLCKKPELTDDAVKEDVPLKVSVLDRLDVSKIQ